MKKRGIKYKIAILFVAMVIIISSKAYAKSDIIVMLDPGHGGNDSGAVGGGLLEKNINWKIASRVKQILDNTPGITGILTKSEDETLDKNLDRRIRADRAKNNNADLLVSFHINSNNSSNKLSGAEVYITHNTKQKRYYEYSNKLGMSILENLRNVGVRSFEYKPKTKVGTPRDVYSDGVVADYYGIISWPMHYGIPSVLVEHCFINNPSDRINYLNDSMINKMAEADAKAIIDNKELFRREYIGNVNTELISIDQIQSSTGKSYIGGYMYIAEWVGNDCRTPSDMPNITLKSTDGKVSQKMYVGYEGGIKYYFDKNMEDLDINKEYYIEVELTGKKNIAPTDNKKQIVNLPNKTLNQDYKGRTLKTINNKVVFSEGEYKGDIKTTLENIKLVQNGNGESYIGAYANIEEIVDGVSRTPRSMPEVYLKSTDGKVSQKMYVGYEEQAKYYFDGKIEYLDTSKEYYIEAVLTSEDNISKNKIQKIATGDKTIGEFNGITVTSKGDNIILTYEGNINTELSEMKVIQNAKGENYISGNIYIAEWVKNVCKTPSTLPSMKLKSTDGTFEKEMYVNHKDGIAYYYDVNIEKIDISKEYYIEVHLTNPNNKVAEDLKTQVAKIKLQGEVGITTSEYKVIVDENKIKLKDKSKYYGTINTELSKMNIIQNGKGDNYISGYIYIAEWVGKECRTPKEMPQIKLKSTDGTYEGITYINHEKGIEYYFDKNIEGLDTTKEYYLEVKLTGKKNTAPTESKTQIAKITPQGQIGICTNENKVIVTKNNIKIEEYKYYGTINTELSKMRIIQNGKGDNYISGYIYIAEWVGKECRTPKEMPQIKLKSTDGTYEGITYINHEKGIEYYFDKNIEGLDTTKEYYLEVKLTGKKNTAPTESKTQIAKITPQGQIGICTNGNKVLIEKNKILIQEKNKKQETEKEIEIVENLQQNDTKQEETKEKEETKKEKEEEELEIVEKQDNTNKDKTTEKIEKEVKESSEEIK